MENKPENEDRRIQRTRELLKKSIFELMTEKRFDKITVQDIIDRANIGRSTFYAHFQDKEELAVASLVEMFDQLNGTLSQKQIDDGRLLPCKELFEHVAENFATFKSLSRGHALDLFYERGQAYWSMEIQKRIKTLLPPEKKLVVPVTVLSAFVAGAFVSMLKWWMDQKMPYTPEKMDEMLHQMILPAIQHAIS